MPLPFLRACRAAALFLAVFLPLSPAWAATPTVTSVVVPANGTYVYGQNIDFTVNWDTNVTVTGTPQLALTFNTGGTKYADYVSQPTANTMLFRYSLVQGLVDGDGIAVGALTLNGGTIEETATNDPADLTLNSMGSTANVLVDTVTPTLPAANIVVGNQFDPQLIVMTFSTGQVLNGGGVLKTIDASTLGNPADWVVTSHDGSITFVPAAVSLSAGRIVRLTLPPVDGGNLATMVTNALAVGHLKVTPPTTLADSIGDTYASGLVTESGASHILDVTPPNISALSLASVSAGAAALTLTTSEKVRGFWIAVPTGSPAPTEAQVMLGANYGAVTVLAHGIAGVAMGAGVGLDAAGLPAGTELDFYVAANDAAGNAAGTVLMLHFVVPQPPGIPTLSPGGVLLLAALLALLGFAALTRAATTPRSRPR